jgi:hypothetical protein
LDELCTSEFKQQEQQMKNRPMRMEPSASLRTRLARKGYPLLQMNVMLMMDNPKKTCGQRWKSAALLIEEMEQAYRVS